MRAVTSKDGTVLVPTRAEGPNGEVGDGLVPLTARHPLFREWKAWLAAQAGPDKTGGKNGSATAV